MIKIVKLRFLICLLAILCSGVLSTIIKKEASASSGSVVTLQDGKNTKYDITNDGKKDVIQLKKAGAESDWFTSYKVYINGKCALIIKNLYYYGANVQLMRLSNNKSYLFIHLAGDNGDGPSNIYRSEPLPAKAGRFKLLLKQPKVVSAQGYRFSPPLLSYFKVI